MRKKSIETKIMLGMGKGVGANYKPWIEAGEFGSQGTASTLTDIRTGRVVHLLSQAEMMAYRTFSFDPNVEEIREQFPLPIDETVKIANYLNIVHPMHDGKYNIMTTDLLVIYKDGTRKAFAVKYKERMNERAKEKLEIEKAYWKLQGVEWKLLTNDDFNPVRVANIRNVSIYYNRFQTTSDMEILKHMIARHEIEVNMDVELNYIEMLKEHRKDIEQWKVTNSKLVESSPQILLITE